MAHFLQWTKVFLFLRVNFLLIKMTEKDTMKAAIVFLRKTVLEKIKLSMHKCITKRQWCHTKFSVSGKKKPKSTNVTCRFFFFSPHGLWKSAKWEQTERLIRRSRFWCSGSNENQMTSTVIHHHRATLCTYQAMMLYWNGSQKVMDTGICRDLSLCVKYGEQTVALCHYVWTAR